jgi:hypothetical protein
MSLNLMMRTTTITGTMTRPQPRIAMNRHHRPALINRRLHRNRLRHEIQRELELLRGVVAALRGLEGMGVSTPEGPDGKYTL